MRDADLTGKLDREHAPRRIVARVDADGCLAFDGMPSREERAAWASCQSAPDPLAASLPEAAAKAREADEQAAAALEENLPDTDVAALLARAARRAVHADDLRRSRRPGHLLARPVRCGARARTPRPAASRTRGSRRSSPGRAGPDDDAGGEPEPPSRRPCPHDLSTHGVRS
jgi:hypothetical protein